MEITPITFESLSLLFTESGSFTCENALSLYVLNLKSFKSSDAVKLSVSKTAQQLHQVLIASHTIQSSHVTARLKTIVKWYQKVKKSLKGKTAQSSWANFCKKTEKPFHRQKTAIQSETNVPESIPNDEVPVEEPMEIDQFEEEVEDNESDDESEDRSDDEDKENDPDFHLEHDMPQNQQDMDFINTAIRSPLVTATCFRVGLSPGNLMVLTTAMNYANGIPPDNGGNAKQTIYQIHCKHRKELGTKIRDDIKHQLSTGNVVIGWDGKKMGNYTKTPEEPKLIERLAIVASNQTGHQLLGIEKLLSGKYKYSLTRKTTNI